MKETVVVKITQSPNWRELYEAALLEVNPPDLRKGIELACQAMRHRSDDLTRSAGPGALEELRAIADALQNLRTVQRVELRASIEPGGRPLSQSST
jgi:hypothetical protein